MLELQSIVDYRRTDPAIDPVFEAVSSIYWSSTSVSGRTRNAWYVIFSDGSVYNHYAKGEGEGFFLRAVRGGL